MDKIEENKKEFMDLVTCIKRDGIEKLVQWIESSDFFSAPASRQYHGSYAGGLLQHSLNVYHEMLRLLKAFPEVENQIHSEDTVKIISLFHDVCKVNFYGVEKRNRKNEAGVWESYDAYKIDEKFKYGGHGAKSVFIVQNFIRLMPEEAVAIHCHMGAFDGDARSIGGAFEAYPIAWLLHVADGAATYIDEKTID